MLVRMMVSILLVLGLVSCDRPSKKAPPLKEASKIHLMDVTPSNTEKKLTGKPSPEQTSESIAEDGIQPTKRVPKSARTHIVRSTKQLPRSAAIHAVQSTKQTPRSAAAHSGQCVISHEECNSYSSECTSYSEVCTQYDQVCTDYESVCTQYDSFCDAYDDNGDCISYSEECVNYEEQCSAYSNECVQYGSQCDSYEQVCNSYSTVCDDSISDPDYLDASAITTHSADLNWEYTGDKSRISYNTGFNPPPEYCITTPSISEYEIGYQSHYKLENLEPNTTYTLRVCSVDSSGNYSSAGTTLTLTTKAIPADPYDPEVLAVTVNSIDLAWGSYAGYASKISYQVGNSAPTEFCTSVPAISENEIGSADSYLLTNLTPDTEYTFRICSIADLETSPGTIFRASTKAPPPNPHFSTILNSTPTSLSLQWGTYIGYTSRISYIQGSSFPAEYCITNPSISELEIGFEDNIKISDLAPSTTYSFRICTVDLEGNVSSGRTVTGSTKALPLDPWFYTSGQVTDTSIELNWYLYSGYLGRISYSTGSNAPSEYCNTDPSISETVLGSASNYTIGGLTPNTMYTFRICSVNPTDHYSSTGVVIRVTTKREIPADPTHLTVDNSADYSLGLSWNGSAPNYRISYAIGRVPSPGCHDETQISESQILGTTEFVIAELLPGHSYTLRVCSSNSSLDTSNGTLVTTSTKPESPAPSPTQLTAVGDSLSSIQLNWTFANQVWHRVQITMKPGDTDPINCSDGTIINPSVDDGLAMTINNLNADTTYSFRVCSPNSNADPDITLGPVAHAQTKQLDFLNNSYLLRMNEDVDTAILNNEYTSPSDHYLKIGYTDANRAVSEIFDENYYRQNNPDVAAAIEQRVIQSGLLHFVKYGQNENRKPSIYFDTQYYSSHYPEVQAEISAGHYSSLADHFYKQGLKDKKRGSLAYDENYYLNAYPEVALEIEEGVFQSGLEHYLSFGINEGRKPFATHETVPLYRAYNPNADYHFFTTAWNEYINAVEHGYQAENIAFNVFHSKDDDDLQPILRLYNPNNGRHYYTINSAERDYLVQLGWRFEKEEGYIYATEMEGTQEVFRLYNRNTGVHLYTIHEAEKDSILQNLGHSWEQHSSLGFAVP